LVAVAFQHAASALLRQLGDVPGVAPGQRLALGIVAVVGVAREGVGVGVRVPVVGTPGADVDVVRAGAVLGQRLLAVAGDDLQLDAGRA
jgi:hypothetical protein